MVAGLWCWSAWSWYTFVNVKPSKKLSQEIVSIRISSMHITVRHTFQYISYSLPKTYIFLLFLISELYQKVSP